MEEEEEVGLDIPGLVLLAPEKLVQQQVVGLDIRLRQAATSNLSLLACKRDTDRSSTPSR